MKQIVILVVLGLLILGCSEGPAEQQTIKISASLPLTGDVAFLGEGAQHAIEMALADLGETKYRYEVIYEDDGLTANKATTAAQKLANVDRVDVIVSLSSGTGNAISPVAESNEVIHIAMASDAEVAKGKYNFIHWTTPKSEAETWIAEAERQGIQRVAIIGINHPGVLAVTKTLINNPSSLDIVFEEYFMPGETDFKTILLKAQKTNPDIYMFEAFSPDLELLHRQYLELEIEEPITAIETFGFSDEPERFNDFWYVDNAVPSNDFIENFEAGYGREPTLGAGNAYDIIKLIAYAYERAGTDPAVKPSDDAVIQVLENLRDYPGVVGTLNAGNDGIIDSPAAVRVMRDGKPENYR